MTPKQRRQRNRDIALWLVVGLIGVVLTPYPAVWAITYGLGTALALAVYQARRS